MQTVLAVALGGAAGSVMRYFAVGLVAFPYGTMLVNVAGSFAIGMAMELAPVEARPLIVTGVLGGFTTFSAFSYDVVKLMQTGRMPEAALYVLGSVALSLLAAFGGVYLARAIGATA